MSKLIKYQQGWNPFLVLGIVLKFSLLEPAYTQTAKSELIYRGK